MMRDQQEWGAMSVSVPRARRSRWLAWGLATFFAALHIGAFIVDLVGGTSALGLVDVFGLTIALAFVTVGVLVASRQPRNAIGWIMLGVAVSTGLDNFAFVALVEQRAQGGADAGALVGAAAVFHEYAFLGFAMVPVTFLVLLFPNGHLPSRRWRPIAWSAAGGIGGVLVTGAMVEPLAGYPTLENPFAVDGAVVDALFYPCVLAMYVGIFGSVASVVVRYRRAGRVERQQIKWLATAGSILALVLPVDVALSGVLGGAAFVSSTVAVLGLPVAVGIAILRHRLYDVDVVINRALVYGALTAGLAGTYLASVLLLQLLLGAITANNGLAIAGSTLAIAALFQPARRRIQSVVDRRFFRRKYDAARTLERFGAHLREEVDLDALGDELRAVVAETMQPAHVSLWLRAPKVTS